MKVCGFHGLHGSRRNLLVIHSLTQKSGAGDAGNEGHDEKRSALREVQSWHPSRGIGGIPMIIIHGDLSHAWRPVPGTQRPRREHSRSEQRLGEYWTGRDLDVLCQQKNGRKSPLAAW